MLTKQGHLLDPDGTLPDSLILLKSLTYLTSLKFGINMKFVPRTNLKTKIMTLLDKSGNDITGRYIASFNFNLIF